MMCLEPFALAVGSPRGSSLSATFLCRACRAGGEAVRRKILFFMHTAARHIQKRRLYGSTLYWRGHGWDPRALPNSAYMYFCSARRLLLFLVACAMAAMADRRRLATSEHGCTSPAFLVWQRFGDKRVAPLAYLSGTRERQLEERLQQAYYSPFCASRTSAHLVASAVSNAPRHMRSDVDRVVFGRDMDSSETAKHADGGGTDWGKARIERTHQDHGVANSLIERLTQQRATPARPASAWAGQAASYIRIEPLSVACWREEVAHRRMGASRPTRVQPRPQSALVAMRAARESPVYAAEMEKVMRARIQAHTRPRTASPGPFPCR